MRCGARCQMHLCADGKRTLDIQCEHIPIRLSLSTWTQHILVSIFFFIAKSWLSRWSSMHVQRMARARARARARPRCTRCARCAVCIAILNANGMLNNWRTLLYCSLPRNLLFIDCTLDLVCKRTKCKYTFFVSHFFRSTFLFCGSMIASIRPAFSAMMVETSTGYRALGALLLLSTRRRDGIGYTYVCVYMGERWVHLCNHNEWNLEFSPGFVACSM